jgi:uncharacterized protein YbjT (DUF2867 family)
LALEWWMKNQIVTVFGGDGFLGRYIVQKLLAAGAQVRVASRNPKRGWFLKAQANLGQISWIAADLTRPETLIPAVAGATAVVNLVGRFDNMDAIHVEGARALAQATAAAGVSAFVQMSAIGADAESASNYGRTKGEGEAAVRAAFPAATILRPSLVFGREDQFTNRFAAMIRMFPAVPVMRGAAKFQPVYVGDVALAVVRVLSGAGQSAPNPHAGKTYELGGPAVMTMADINTWLAKATGRERWFIDMPDVFGAAMARVTGFLPGAPITWDQWLMLQQDNIVAPDANGLATLGVEPTPLDAVAPAWLVQYRKHGRFSAKATR